MVNLHGKNRISQRFSQQCQGVINNVAFNLCEIHIRQWKIDSSCIFYLIFNYQGTTWRKPLVRLTMSLVDYEDKQFSLINNQNCYLLGLTIHLIIYHITTAISFMKIVHNKHQYMSYVELGFNEKLQFISMCSSQQPTSAISFNQ